MTELRLRFLVEVNSSFSPLVILCLHNCLNKFKLTGYENKLSLICIIIFSFQSGPLTKHGGINDILERIKEEFNMVQNQYHK